MTLFETKVIFYFLLNFIFLVINITLFVPFVCLADMFGSYLAKAKEILSLFNFLNGIRIPIKRLGDPSIVLGLIREAIEHRAEEMEVRKIDFRIGKMNVEMSKLMLVDFEGKITIPNRFAATNESLFENFHPMLKGCEKYEVVYYKTNIMVEKDSLTVEKMVPVLFALKCCFRGEQCYKVNLKGSEKATVVLKGKTNFHKDLENGFSVLFEYG